MIVRSVVTNDWDNFKTIMRKYNQLYSITSEVDDLHYVSLKESSWKLFQIMQSNYTPPDDSKEPLYDRDGKNRFMSMETWGWMYGTK